MSHSQLVSAEQRAERTAQIQARLNGTSLDQYSMYDFGPLGCTTGDAYFFGDARADVAFLLEEIGRVRATDAERAFLAAGHAYCAARREAFDRAQQGSLAEHKQREQLVDLRSHEVLFAMLALEPRSSRDAGLPGDGRKS